MKKNIQLNVIIMISLLSFTSCSNKKKNYSLNDLISFSKAKYGFVKKDGTINEFYGDFEFVPKNNIFDFNVGCGSRGDIISVIAMINSSKSNCFDLFIPEGDKYFGKNADSNKKVGELELISENEIHGQINLCMEEGSGCCGIEGENFILKKISTSTELPSNKEKGFTIKKNIDLPSWFSLADRTYMLNDARIVESNKVEFIGGYFPKKGEIFFINNKEVIFPENVIKITKIKTLITKTLISGDYVINITWDTSFNTGAYSEGTISLFYKNVSIFNSSLVISGW